MAGIRTVVVHTGGIGDFLLSIPALQRLHGEGPVQLVGHRERVALAVAGGVGDAAFDMDAVGFGSVFAEPDARFWEFFSGFNRAVVWMKDDGRIEAALRGCGIADVRVFPGLPPVTWARHASEYYLGCLGCAEAPPLRLAIPPGDTARDVVIHPGSGGQYKNWPLDRFVEVAERLVAEGRSVSWVTGPAEENVALPDGASVLPLTSLVDLAAHLAASRLYFGNDSGITHLAAAVGCPCVAIFGPTEPSVWAPRGGHVTVAHGQPWPEVEQVAGAAAMQSEKCKMQNEK
jgi:Glycosyltransferase family 9 (heptosyltransferase)